jgi:hypothetical protein
MGWESQPPAAVLRNFPVRKAAVIGGALTGAVAIWLVASMVSGTTAPVAPPIIVQAAPTPPAPMPSVPEPPPVPEVVATAPVDPPETEVRDAGPAPTRKARAAAAVATTRPAPKPPVETAPPPSSKPERPARTVEPPPPPAPKERPTRLASATSSPISSGSVEPEPHRAPVVPQPPAPIPEVAPPPAPAAEPPPPAPTPAAPQVVAPTALDANRIAGDKSIMPDPTTMAAIGRSGETTLISSYKVCVTAEGNVNTVTLLRSTGFPAYDTKIQTTIRKDWRYKPFLMNGKATPVCTALRFVYSQK